LGKLFRERCETRNCADGNIERSQSERGANIHRTLMPVGFKSSPRFASRTDVYFTSRDSQVKRFLAGREFTLGHAHAVAEDFEVLVAVQGAFGVVHEAEGEAVGAGDAGDVLHRAVGVGIFRVG